LRRDRLVRARVELHVWIGDAAHAGGLGANFALGALGVVVAAERAAALEAARAIDALEIVATTWVARRQEARERSARERDDQCSGGRERERARSRRLHIGALCADARAADVRDGCAARGGRDSGAVRADDVTNRFQTEA